VSQNSSENTERFSLRELLFAISMSRTRLLIFARKLYIIGLHIVLFLSHIGTLPTLLVLKNFLLNQSKSNSRELLMIGIGIVLAR